MAEENKKLKKEENNNSPIILGKLSITELMHFKEACIMLIEYYIQEIKLTELCRNAEEQKKNKEAIDKKMQYNKIFYIVIKEIERRVNLLCLS